MTDTAKAYRLAGQASPYLRQHADNPVEWYPWGEEALRRAYRRVDAISVDHGVMEKAHQVYAVPAEFCWSDLGSWEGLAEVVGGSDGVRIGDEVSVDSEGSVLVTEGPLVAALGVPGVVVVATRDAVLVIPRDACQRVKDIVVELRRRGRDELL